MVLAYWSQQLHRPELNHTVPETAKAIADGPRGDTGNWPFNTAYAGRYPGMRAYVTRLGDIAELEDWIAAGIPVIISVSSYLTSDRTSGPDNGHLIVCVGFTDKGDVVANDPGVSVRTECARPAGLCAGEGRQRVEEVQEHRLPDLPGDGQFPPTGWGIGTAGCQDLDRSPRDLTPVTGFSFNAATGFPEVEAAAPSLARAIRTPCTKVHTRCTRAAQGRPSGEPLCIWCAPRYTTEEAKRKLTPPGPPHPIRCCVPFSLFFPGAAFKLPRIRVWV